MRRPKTCPASLVAKVLAVAVASILLPAGVGGAAASADPIFNGGNPMPSGTSPEGSKVTRIEKKDEQQIVMYVYSASMGKEIRLDILRPRDTSVPRPTLYLLNGAGGGEDGATWWAGTDAKEFFSDKNVNVVVPVGGAFSYYTDWKNPDPVLGVNKWTTFLTKEVPPLIDEALDTTGVNAIAGLSSSGTSVLQLAIAAPGLYRGVASYSGCAQTSDPLGQTFVSLTVETWGHGSTLNMWGPKDDPAWAANDPYVHADGLRGLELYVSNSSGLPGTHDTLDGPHVGGQADILVEQIVIGGGIEAATNYCTHNLADRLTQLGIPATFKFREGGTHSWGYWQDAVKDSWPVLARALCI